MTSCTTSVPWYQNFRTKRSHARSQINRIFSKVVFWRGSRVFRSFPLCLGGAGYRQSRATLNGNPKGRTTLKMGFLFASGYLACRKFIWSEDLLSSFLLSIIDRELFDWKSFFSFSFLSFHFFLSDLSLGIRVLAFVIRSP